MAKQRRNAVDEVLGGASPVARKIRAQKEAARLAREEDNPVNTSPDEEASVPARPRSQPKPTTPVAAKSARSGGRSEQAPVRRDRNRNTTSKRRPAKRIPVMGTEGEVWEDVCRTLSGCVGAKVTFAAASRAIWSMVVEVEDALDQFDAPQLIKPANADVIGNADFEDQIKEFIREVLIKGKRS